MPASQAGRRRFESGRPLSSTSGGGRRPATPPLLGNSPRPPVPPRYLLGLRAGADEPVRPRGTAGPVGARGGERRAPPHPPPPAAGPRGNGPVGTTEGI